VRFPSYPYEWAPEMLHSAAIHTLHLAEEALNLGCRLKDATPYNIMFEGPRPVFLDLLSFHPGEPLDPLWLAQAQFIRTFVYPLLAKRYFGIEIHEILLGHRDGLAPERMLRLCPFWRRVAPTFLRTVTLPALLSGGSKAHDPKRYQPRRARSPGEASYLQDRLLRHCRRVVEAAKPRETTQVSWYETNHSYSAPALKWKEAFVAEVMSP
jgi:hypothetical protein